VELDANGPAQYLVVAPKFGVVAFAAGHMFACGVSHRCPFTTAGAASAVLITGIHGWHPPLSPGTG
jgi:hypothetical protein